MYFNVLTLPGAFVIAFNIWGHLRLILYIHYFAESKVTGRMTWAAVADGQKILSPGSETGLDPWEPAGIGDEHQQSQLQCPPCTWGGGWKTGRGPGSSPPAGQRRGWSSSQLSEPLSPETGPPCRPRRLTAPRAPQPQPRPGRTWCAHPGSASCTGYARGCRPRVAAGGRRCALRPASLHRGLGHQTQHGPAGPGRGATRSGRPKAGAGWRRVPSTPRRFSESPRRLRWPGAPHPSLAAQRSTATPAPSLEGVEGWVWAGGGSGGGPGGGAVSAAGPCSAPPRSLSVSPPPSSCSGRSPAWGGRRPAGQVR